MHSGMNATDTHRRTFASALFRHWLRVIRRWNVIAAWDASLSVLVALSRSLVSSCQVCVLDKAKAEHVFSHLHAFVSHLIYPSSSTLEMVFAEKPWIMQDYSFVHHALKDSHSPHAAGCTLLGTWADQASARSNWRRRACRQCEGVVLQNIIALLLANSGCTATH